MISGFWLLNQCHLWLAVLSDLTLLFFIYFLIIQVFGGSWGSTLAFAYSQSHTDEVHNLLDWLLFFLLEFWYIQSDDHQLQEFFPFSLNYSVFLSHLLLGYRLTPKRYIPFVEEIDWLVLWRWCCCYLPQMVCFWKIWGFNHWCKRCLPLYPLFWQVLFTTFFSWFTPSCFWIFQTCLSMVLCLRVSLLEDYCMTLQTFN